MMDNASELRHSIMSSIARDGLGKLSSRIRFGYQQAIRHDAVPENNTLFGCKKQKGRMCISEPKAGRKKDPSLPGSFRWLRGTHVQELIEACEQGMP